MKGVQSCLNQLCVPKHHDHVGRGPTKLHYIIKLHYLANGAYLLVLAIFFGAKQGKQNENTFIMVALLVSAFPTA